MGTSWATNSWATNSWAANTWAALAGAMETLGAGDLTTALAVWLSGVAADVNTSIRGRLATNYSVSADTADTSSLLAKFLQLRA